MPPSCLLNITTAAATRAASIVIATSLTAESLTSSTNDESYHEKVISKTAVEPPLSPFITNLFAAIKATPFRQKHITSCENLSMNSTLSAQEKEQISFQKSLKHHRSLLQEYKQKWDYVENRASRVPTTQWPAYPHTLPFPHTTDIETLFPDLKYCQASPNYQNDKDSYCHPLQFQIAYILLSQQQESAESLTNTKTFKNENSNISIQEISVRTGFTLLKELAESGHADSMCLYAQTLNNGNSLIPLEPNPISAVAWWHHCYSLHPNHAQTIYELGVASYTGEGTPEDEFLAVKYFTIAAKLGHAGAAYMLGDCLLDGVGCINNQRDRALALHWLVKSGEWGHRGARSRVLAVLEYQEGGDYGGFTDASRQTLVEEEDLPASGNPYNQSSRVSTVKVQEHVTKRNRPLPTVADMETDMEEDLETEEEEELRHWAQVRENVLLNERKFTIGGPSSVAVLQKRKTVVTESRN